MLSEISLKIACPETFRRSGCFDSHIYIMHLVGCVLFTSLHGVAVNSSFVETDDIVMTLHSGYIIFVAKLWRVVALSLVSTNVTNENL